MAELQIRGHTVEIDIADELSEYDFGYNPRWTTDKLIASSPFRTDQAPSFFVNLDGEYAGTFGDSGAIDDEYSRGGFVKLISLLRNIGEDEASEYLIEKYGVLHEIIPNEPIRLRHPKIEAQRTKSTYIEVNPIVEATSPYLLRRGISSETQSLFGTGYVEGTKGITAIPWNTPDGRLANIKYRSTTGKRFFYHKGGTSINDLVYAIDLADINTVIVEGEIDAMSWRESGYSAIAIAGAHLSDKQIDLIKRSKVERLYVGGDNDVQGRKFNDQIKRSLRGNVQLYTINYGEEKDANDILTRQGVRGLKRILAQSTRIKAINLR